MPLEGSLQNGRDLVPDGSAFTRFKTQKVPKSPCTPVPSCLVPSLEAADVGTLLKKDYLIHREAFFFLVFKDFFIFRERGGEGKEKDRERGIDA